MAGLRVEDYNRSVLRLSILYMTGMRENLLTEHWSQSQRLRAKFRGEVPVASASRGARSPLVLLRQHLNLPFVEEAGKLVLGQA